MRAVCYTLCLLLLLLFSGACTKTSVYEQKAKTVDSLSGAVNAVMKQLSDMDTLALQRSVLRFTWYRQFIRQNVNDTLSREEADNLLHFYTSGKNLERVSDNRKQILTRALLINSQLSKLAEDIRHKRLSAEQLAAYSQHEKDEAALLIQAGSQQQKLFHSSLEEFRTSLKRVELLIRSRNKGELPTIIKDTVSL